MINYFRWLVDKTSFCYSFYCLFCIGANLQEYEFNKALCSLNFLARYRAYVIASKFFVVDTITFERINRLTSTFAHVETEQK